MLRVDPKDRVNIYQVAEFPKISKRIKQALGKEKYNEEFSKGNKNIEMFHQNLNE